MTEPTIDTQALNTIVDIMKENRQWSADELDAIAAVLDAVRARDGENWKATGPILEWRDGRYVAPAPARQPDPTSGDDTDAIHRYVYQVELFSRGPWDEGEGDTLAQINYDITDGECIGDVHQVSVEIVPPEKVEEHLLRIGNDGSFFEDLFEDEDVEDT